MAVMAVENAIAGVHGEDLPYGYGKDTLHLHWNQDWNAKQEPLLDYECW